MACGDNRVGARNKPRAGIYNVANATCISDCISCCGVSNFSLTPSQIICPVGGTMSFSFGAVDCNGFAVWPNLSSSNTAVMTVDSTNLNVTGVSTGQADLRADWGNVFTTSNGGLQQFCGISSCPTTYQATSSTVNVGKTLFYISNTCQIVSGFPTMIAGWETDNFACVLSDTSPPGLLPQGGSCVTIGIKRCYEITTPTCQQTFCPGDKRVADGACTKFLDQFPIITSTIPGGCHP